MVYFLRWSCRSLGSFRRWFAWTSSDCWRRSGSCLRRLALSSLFGSFVSSGSMKDQGRNSRRCIALFRQEGYAAVPWLLSFCPTDPEPLSHSVSKDLERLQLRNHAESGIDAHRVVRFGHTHWIRLGLEATPSVTFHSGQTTFLDFRSVKVDLPMELCWRSSVRFAALPAKWNS